MRQSASSPSLCYVVTPCILEQWFSDFAEIMPDDRVIYTNTTESIDKLTRLICSYTQETPEGWKVVFCSNHYSLARDHEIAARLQAKGYEIVGISGKAVMYGLDKLKAKRLFEELGIATPPWTPVKKEDALSQVLLRINTQSCILKTRSGTSGTGNFYTGANSETPSLRGYDYAEAFIDGTEYSVIAVSTAGGIATFPPVWKGSTRRDLLPPHKRLRLCPYLALEPQLEAQMRSTATLLMQTMEASGFFEVEYIITSDQRMMVIEVNPRVAGTLPLSALATATRIFSLGRWDAIQESVPATHYAAEIPFIASPLTTVLEGVYYEQRMSLSDTSYQRISTKILRARQLGVEFDAEAIDTFVREALFL